MPQQLRLAPGAARRHRRAGRQFFNGDLSLESASLRLSGSPFCDRFLRFFRAELLGVAIDQHVANVGALAHGAQCQTGGQLGGQILQTVNGEVGPMFEQSDFEFFGEKPFGQRLGRLGQRRGL